MTTGSHALYHRCRMPRTALSWMIFTWGISVLGFAFVFSGDSVLALCGQEARASQGGSSGERDSGSRSSPGSGGDVGGEWQGYIDLCSGQLLAPQKVHAFHYLVPELSIVLARHLSTGIGFGRIEPPSNHNGAICRYYKPDVYGVGEVAAARYLGEGGIEGHILRYLVEYDGQGRIRRVMEWDELATPAVQYSREIEWVDGRPLRSRTVHPASKVDLSVVFGWDDDGRLMSIDNLRAGCEPRRSLMVYGDGQLVGREDYEDGKLTRRVEVERGDDGLIRGMYAGGAGEGARVVYRFSRNEGIAVVEEFDGGELQVIRCWEALSAGRELYAWARRADDWVGRRKELFAGVVELMEVGPLDVGVNGASVYGACRELMRSEARTIQRTLIGRVYAHDAGAVLPEADWDQALDVDERGNWITAGTPGGEGREPIVRVRRTIEYL